MSSRLPDASRLVAELGLQEHPEGGYFRETFRASEKVMTARGVRDAASGILFLATRQRPSRLHRCAADELWLFHGGAPLELTILLSNGSAESAVLAAVDQLSAGEHFSPQVIVPAGAWQAARPVAAAADVDWSLTSCVVVPGFDFADFEMGEREDLLRAYPEQRELVLALT